MENSIYIIEFYHEFGEPSYHSFEVTGTRAQAIQAARDHKRNHASSYDFFEVSENHPRYKPIYHSLFGAWDDPRLP